MLLKISSPEKIIFEGEIDKIILPTEIGDVTVKEWQKPTVTSLKPGIITISPIWKFREKDFIKTGEWISISISKWVAFICEDLVKIATTIATTKINEDGNKLKEKKAQIEK